MLRWSALFAFAALVLTLGIGAPRAAHAAELQVAFDQAGRVVRIDEDLARRLGLFLDEHPGFREARLFMVDDSSYVLEITVLRGGQTLRERQALTAEQARELRADVERRLATATPARKAPDQEGRPRLLLGAATLGLCFYGWAVPYVFEVQDGSQAFGGYLLTAGGSFFLPMMMTADAPVSIDAADLYWYGSTRGIVHGMLLQDAAGDANHAGTGRVATAMVTSIAEGVLGYTWVTARALDGGAVQSIVTGGDYGLLWGYSIHTLASSDPDRYQSGTAASMLATSVAGMAVGRALAAHRAYSNGDALVMRSAGAVGVGVGSALADAAGVDDASSRPYAIGFLAGSLAGLTVGDRLVAGREFTFGEGVVVELGAAAGALMGLGVVAVVNPQGDVSTPYLAGMAAGGVAGYALAYSGLSRKAAARASEGTSWRWQLDPAGLLAAVQPAGSGRRTAPSPHLARVSVRF